MAQLTSEWFERQLKRLALKALASPERKHAIHFGPVTIRPIVTVTFKADWNGSACAEGDMEKMASFLEGNQP